MGGDVFYSITLGALTTRRLRLYVLGQHGGPHAHDCGQAAQGAVAREVVAVEPPADLRLVRPEPLGDLLLRQVALENVFPLACHAGIITNSPYCVNAQTAVCVEPAECRGYL